MSLPPLQNFIDKQTVVSAAWLNAVDLALHGAVTAQPQPSQYSPTFQSGYLQYQGSDGNLGANTNFIVGLALPNPTGVAAPGLLIGSGVPSACIITDAVLAGNHGIDLTITSGETAAPSNDRGGVLWLIGGAAYNGKGGTLLLQGGTSLNGIAGDLFVQGGNSTGGVAGNVFVSGGLSGTGGGSVHLIMTDLSPGGSGSLVFRHNSDVLMTMNQFGAMFWGALGAGLPGQILLSGGPTATPQWGSGSQAGSIKVSLSGSISPVLNNQTINYETDGNFVHLWVDQAVTGSSNGNSDVILSTLPGFLTPSSNRTCSCGGLINGSGGEYSGQAVVSAVGGITISLLQVLGGTLVGVGSRNAWSSTGLKGINPSWSVVYAL